MGCNKLHLKMIYVMHVHIFGAYKLKLELLKFLNMRIANTEFVLKLYVVTNKVNEND